MWGRQPGKQLDSSRDVCYAKQLGLPGGAPPSQDYVFMGLKPRIASAVIKTGVLPVGHSELQLESWSAARSVRCKRSGRSGAGPRLKGLAHAHGGCGRERTCTCCTSKLQSDRRTEQTRSSQPSGACGNEERSAVDGAPPTSPVWRRGSGAPTPRRLQIDRDRCAAGGELPQRPEGCTGACAGV